MKLHPRSILTPKAISASGSGTLEALPDLRKEKDAAVLVVLGSVKGGPFDDGHATVDAATVAGKFWDLSKARGEIRAEIG